MPGPSAFVRSRARVGSPVVQAPMAAPNMAWVPHSARATTRNWGNAPSPDPRPEPGLANAAAFSGVSATSRVVPSMPTSRLPRQKAPGVEAVPSGTQPRANSSASGASPSRARAWEIAGWEGTLQAWRHPDSQDSPSTRLRMTSS